jgi:DNA-binding HxlR family transcriptional regulator
LSINGYCLLNLKEPDIPQVLQVISDEVSVDIIRIIERNAKNRNDLKYELNISSRLLYDRVRKLMGSGLIKRRGKYYYITSFGRATLRAYAKIAKGIQYLSELKIIESIGNDDLLGEEQAELVDRLVQDIELKEIISKYDRMQTREAAYN